MSNVRRFMKFGVIAAALLLVVTVTPAVLAQEQNNNQQSQQSNPDQQQSNDRPTRPYLGVQLGMNEQGVVVQQCNPDSPAIKAGLRPGDRIIKVDDQDVNDAGHFIQTIARHKPNEQVKLHISSNNQEKDITVTLGDWSMMRGMQNHMGGMQGQMPGMQGDWQGQNRGDWQGQGQMQQGQMQQGQMQQGHMGGMQGRRMSYLGVNTQAITPDMKQRMNVKADNGCVVMMVFPNSPAQQAGLRQNDVITQINDKQVQDPDQLREAVQQVSPGTEVTIHVARGGETQQIKAKLAEQNMQSMMQGMQGMGMGGMPNMQNMQNGMYSRRMGMGDNEMMTNPFERIRELERRIEELEKKLNQMEKK